MKKKFRRIFLYLVDFLLSFLLIFQQFVHASRPLLRAQVRLRHDLQFLDQGLTQILGLAQSGSVQIG